MNLAALKKVLGGASGKLDELLMKSPAMRKKPAGVSVKDGVVSGGQPGLIKSEVDPGKKAALLGALGLGGAGAGVAAMDDEEDDYGGELPDALKKLLGM